MYKLKVKTKKINNFVLKCYFMLFNQICYGFFLKFLLTVFLVVTIGFIPCKNCKKK